MSGKTSQDEAGEQQVETLIAADVSSGEALAAASVVTPAGIVLPAEVTFALAQGKIRAAARALVQANPGADVPQLMEAMRSRGLSGGSYATGASAGARRRVPTVVGGETRGQLWWPLAMLALVAAVAWWLTRGPAG